MKKTIVLIFKSALGLLPHKIKAQLKKSSTLNNFYIKTLQRSGFFFGFPSPHKLKALYRHVLNKQSLLTSTLSKTSDKKLAIVVLAQSEIKGSEAVLNKSLEVIPEQNRKNVVFYFCHTQSIVQQDPKTLQYVPLDLSQWVLDYERTLLICVGDSLDIKLVNYLSIMTLNHELNYVDTDVIEENGDKISANLLPDWNYDLQLTTAYVSTGILLSSPKLLTKIPVPENSINWAQWIVAVAQQINNKIGHIPLSLVSRGQQADEKKETLENIANMCKSEAIHTFDKEHQYISYLWACESKPLTSIIIPTKNAKELVETCIGSIDKLSTYRNFEILLIDNNSDDAESLSYFDKLSLKANIKVLKYPHPFNYSAINNFAVEHANGEVVALVNNDIEVITPQWLDYMVGHAMRDGVGCVGAKLLYPDGRIQHAGVVMGYGGGAGHAHKYFPRHHPGYLNRLAATGNFSAVTAACLIVKKSIYEEVGGLNEKDLTIAFNDVDFCLKVQKAGYRNVYCAEAELYHHESVSRGLDTSPEKAARFKREVEYLQENWADVIKHDPAYNPNLTLRSENFSIKHKDEWTD